MEDLFAELARAPLWPQAGIGLFALTFVVMLLGPGVTHRTYRRRFDTLAQELGQASPRTRGWPVVFSTSIDGRTFELRHDYRSTGRNSSYRGPTGHLLITTTPLAGDRWGMHQVDLFKAGSWLERLGKTTRASGDAAFDARFAVIEDGLPVRDGWLDAPTRDAVARFLDQTPVEGTIWLREGQLQWLMSNDWKTLDGAAIRALLQRQAALAQALEGTAAGRS